MAISDKSIEELVKKINFLSDQTIDFDKFNTYSIVHHSTSIEGSTLTQKETNLLLENWTDAQPKTIASFVDRARPLQCFAILYFSSQRKNKNITRIY